MSTQISYSDSELIQLFPVSHTREYSNSTNIPPTLHNGRLLTEKNLISVFGNINENSSFIISADKSENPDNIKFIIGGYFVDLDIKSNRFQYTGDNGSTTYDNIYAKISLNNQGYLDIEDSYSTTTGSWSLAKGVCFTDDSSAPSTGEYKLHILSKKNGKYIIPESSWYRFSTKSIQNIDGGVV